MSNQTKQLSNKHNQFLQNKEHLLNNLLNKELQGLEINKYQFSVENTMEKLGLDDDLIQELIEEFVSQILENKSLFLIYIEDLKKNKTLGKKLDYTNLRDLAHKNLGVAKNLRIYNAKVLLNELMTQDDLKYLSACLDALEICVIKLNPEIALSILEKEIE